MPTSGSGISTPIPSVPGVPSPFARPRALPRTSLSIQRFAEIVNYSPMLMHQVYVPDLQDASSCSDPVLQYTWQPRAGGRPGRQEIYDAIQQAEGRIETVLGFAVLPKWYNDTISRVYSDAYGRVGMRAGHGYVVEGGVEAWSLIAAGAGITYSDEDGDGYDETASVSVATTVTDPNRISVYYPSTNHDPGWEIRPLYVSIGDGVAQIRFDRHLAVVQTLVESLDAEGVLGTNDANFLTTVDVYAHYTDSSAMAIATWPQGSCGGSALQTGYIGIQDGRNGLLRMTPALWNGTEWQAGCTPYGTPDSVAVSYRAGYMSDSVARPMCDIDPDLERAVVYLAVSYLDREWASCEYIHNLQAHWREDLAARQSSQSGSLSFQVNRQVLDNPFGTTRAAVFAWRTVQPLIVGQAVLV